MVEAPLYNKLLNTGKKPTVQGGCALPSNVDLAGVYDIVKGTANAEYKTCVNGLITAASKEVAKEDIRKDFVGRSESYISNNNLLNCKDECFK